MRPSVRLATVLVTLGCGGLMGLRAAAPPIAAAPRQEVADHAIILPLLMAGFDRALEPSPTAPPGASPTESGGSATATSAVRPTSTRSGPQPSSTPAPSRTPRADSLAQPLWLRFPSLIEALDMAFEPDGSALWVGTRAGVLRWDLATEAYGYYSANDGLLSDIVKAVFVDSRGNRWFSAGRVFNERPTGVTRLSPKGEWTYLRADDGLPGDVWDIAEDAAGTVWLATSQGAVSVSTDGSVNTVELTDGLVAADLRAVAVAPDGGLWFGSANQGLHFRKANGTWERFGVGARLPTDGAILDVLVADDGRVFVAHDLGVSRRARNGAWTDLAGVPGKAQRLALDAAGRLYVAHLNKGSVTLLTPDGKATTLNTSNSGLGSNIAYSLLSAPDGSVWFGTGAGIARFAAAAPDADPAKAELWTDYPLGPGLAGYYTNGMSVGPDGSVWMAQFFGDGISRLGPDGRWSRYREQLLSQEDDTLNVTVDAAGNAWVATKGGLSVRRADGQWRHFRHPQAGHPEWEFMTDIQDIAVGADGVVWIGARHALLRYDPATEDWRIFRVDGFGVPLTWCMGLMVTADGSLWIAQYGNGLVRLAPDGQWERFDEFLPSTVAYAVAQGPDGSIWAGTDQGIAVRWPDGRWEMFEAEEGGLAHPVVRAIAFDRDGSAWVGTKYGGISIRHTDGSWRQLDFGDGLPSNAVTSIVFDPAGRPWIGTYNGVVNLDPREPGDSCATAARRATGSSIISEAADALDLDVYALPIDDPFTAVSVSLGADRADLELLWVDSCLALETLVTRHQAALALGAQDGALRNAVVDSASVGRDFLGTQRVDKRIDSRTGTYYVVVRPKRLDAAYPIRYRLDIGISSAGASSTRTLILTHEPAVRQAFGLAADAPELAAWRAGLERLAADPRVMGEIIWDLQAAPLGDEVRQAHANLLAAANSPALYQEEARRFVAAMRDWIWQRRGTDLRRLRYVILAGDDRIVPHMRLRVEPPFEARFDDGWKEESAYLEELDSLPAPLDPLSPVRAALLLDQTLGDDAYGARTTIPWGVRGLRMTLPELAIGRLVERPADMLKEIETFLGLEGRVQVTRSLVGGHDFMQDGAEVTDAYLSRAKLPDADRQRYIGDAWTADALRTALQAGRFDLAFLALHSSHYLHRAPDDQDILAAQILEGGSALDGKVILSLACHGGLNVPGEGHAQALDFPEAWSQRGGTLVGSTGWAYGFERALQYQEDLLAELARRTVSGEGVAIGEALAEAKREYYWDVASLNHFHAKTLAGTVLYGLPMLRVSGPQAADGPGSGAEPEESAYVGVVENALDRASEGLAAQRVDMVVKPGSFEPVPETEGTYYTLKGQRPRVEGGEPLQPRWQYGLLAQDFEGDYLEPRGVVWEGADYEAIGGFQPLVRRAGILGSWDGVPEGKLGAAQDEPIFSAPGWYPSLPVDLRTLPTGTDEYGRSEGRLLYTLGQFDSGSRTQLLLNRVGLTVYYAAAGDQEAPTISEVAGEDAAGQLRLRVTAADASGLLRVLATWTDGGGRWQSTDLSPQPGTETWQADLPAAAAALIQVVDRAGNVRVADNEGAFYRRP